MHSDFDAYDCSGGGRGRGGGADTVREAALKVVDPGRKIPCRTKESNLRQRRAGPMLYQLSYGVVPKSLLAFLGFLCNAEFSPCSAFPEYIRAFIHLACLWVFTDAMGFAY